MKDKSIKIDGITYYIKEIDSLSVVSLIPTIQRIFPSDDASTRPSKSLKDDLEDLLLSSEIVSIEGAESKNGLPTIKKVKYPKELPSNPLDIIKLANEVVAVITGDITSKKK